MKLTDLFVNNKPIDGNGKAQQKTTQNMNSMSRQIHALKPGQILQGEVIARNGSEVQIQVSEDFVIKARVEQNVNLELGKNMTFEVKNNGQTLNLLPLYTNTAMDANVLKALDMASLPVNAETISMTEQMMLAGMSIDRNSLQQVFRESNLFPESNISDIIDLHKLSMPVNETNLSQLASYKNLTHQLANGLQEVASTLSDTIQGMLQKGDTDGAAKLFQDILNLVSGNETINETGLENTSEKTVILTDDSINSQNANVTPQNGSGGLAMGSMPTNDIATPLQADLQLLLDMLAARSGSEAGVAEGSMLMDGAPMDGALSDGAILQNGEGMTAEGNLNQKADGAAVADVQNMVNTAQSEMMTQKETAIQGNVVNGQKQQDTALSLLQRLVQQGIRQNDKALLQNILSNKEIAAFVKENLRSQWSVRPQDVADEGKVTQLYQRLDKQLKGLAQALENAGQTGTDAYKATANLTQNLDFLQQLNQTYTYLQLPLRLQQGNNAHGDLYVYSNKKHLASKDGKITALLHLDMEHLGPVDVYVAMQQEKVSTKFYVRDDEMLNFLEGHMDILTQRLKKRGYNCSYEMQTREADGEREETVVQKLLEKEPQIPIVQYAFDVRT